MPNKVCLGVSILLNKGMFDSAYNYIKTAYVYAYLYMLILLIVT